MNFGLHGGSGWSCEDTNMKKGPFDERVLCNLFLEALAEQDGAACQDRDDDVVVKGYLVDPEMTVEPHVLDTLNELDRRARRTAT